MAEYMVDLRDIKFVLMDQIGMDELLSREAYEDFDVDDVVAILEEGMKYAKDVFWPLSAEGDKIGAKWEDGKVTLPPGTKEACTTVVLVRSV